MNSRYQWSVKPLSGNDGTSELLNEKISRIDDRRVQEDDDEREEHPQQPARRCVESATSISPAPPAAAG